MSSRITVPEKVTFLSSLDVGEQVRSKKNDKR